MSRALCGIGVLAVLGTACAGLPLIQTDVDAPAGALRVGLVADLATKSQMLEQPDYHALLLSAGLEDKDIADGSVIRTQLHCCDGPETITYGVAFVPSKIKVQRGDLVEIRVAPDPDAAGLDRLNVVTQIRQPRDTTPSRCNWIPSQPGLWRKTPFCDWMPEEGWVEVRSWGLPILWMKPAGSQP